MGGAGSPDIVATYPSRWDSSTAALMKDSLVYAGLERVTLVSDAEAVSAWFESEIAALAGTLIGIYHVDDTGAAVTLVRSGVAAAARSALRATGVRRVHASRRHWVHSVGCRRTWTPSSSPVTGSRRQTKQP
ncbi:hypothetical protein GCM10020255_068420 [Rhodococcus baikonurensis]